MYDTTITQGIVPVTEKGPEIAKVLRKCGSFWLCFSDLVGGCRRASKQIWTGRVLSMHKYLLDPLDKWPLA